MRGYLVLVLIVLLYFSLILLWVANELSTCLPELARMDPSLRVSLWFSTFWFFFLALLSFAALVMCAWSEGP